MGLSSHRPVGLSTSLALGNKGVTASSIGFILLSTVPSTCSLVLASFRQSRPCQGEPTSRGVLFMIRTLITIPSRTVTIFSWDLLFLQLFVELIGAEHGSC